MPKHYKDMIDEWINKMDEDAPANAVAHGGVDMAPNAKGRATHNKGKYKDDNTDILPLEGGIEAAYRSDIENADDPKLELQKITSRLNKLRSPLRSAESFLIEEIIDPRHTRRIMCEFADLSGPLRKTGKTYRTMRP